MEEIELSGSLLVKLIEAGYKNLAVNEKIVNDLNVFPIPDGDTGKNMLMTLEGGFNAIKGDLNANVSEIAKRCAEGMLVSARGNSGVILSQLFYGFSKGLSDIECAKAKDVIAALGEGVKYGYGAVSEPTEGTMLTVARESFENVNEAKEEIIGVKDLITRLVSISNKSVQETPEKLPILKQSGVVDSGGAGIYYIFEGMNKCLNGEAIVAKNLSKAAEDDIDYSKFNENSVLEFGYCSEILLQLQTSKIDIEKFDIDEFKNYLSSIGDSIVLVKTGSVVKVHVHTFAPYKLLEYAQKFGEFLKIKIENMTLQHSEVTIENNFKPILAEQQEKKKFAVVTVASGDGIVNLFTELGADVVIDGGQTNNPSIEDFIKAFNKVNAENIFVLPNNSNVIMAANQAASMFKESKVYVIESRNIGEGYAALSMLDYSSGDANLIATNIWKEIGKVRTGMISQATRSVTLNGIDVKQGHYIGLVGKNVLADSQDKVSVAKILLEQMMQIKANYCVFIFGKTFNENEINELSSFMSENYPLIENYSINGEQDIYDLYIIAS